MVEKVLTKKVIIKCSEDLTIVVTDDKIFSMRPNNLRVIIFGYDISPSKSKTLVEVEFNRKYLVIIDKEKNEVVIPLPYEVGNSLIKN